MFDDPPTSTKLEKGSSTGSGKETAGKEGIVVSEPTKLCSSSPDSAASTTGAGAGGVDLSLPKDQKEKLKIGANSSASATAAALLGATGSGTPQSFSAALAGLFPGLLPFPHQAAAAAFFHHHHSPLFPGFPPVQTPPSSTIASSTSAAGSRTTKRNIASIASILANQQRAPAGGELAAKAGRVESTTTESPSAKAANVPCIGKSGRIEVKD